MGEEVEGEGIGRGEELGEGDSSGVRERSNVILCLSSPKERKTGMSVRKDFSNPISRTNED